MCGNEAWLKDLSSHSCGGWGTTWASHVPAATRDSSPSYLSSANSSGPVNGNTTAKYLSCFPCRRRHQNESQRHPAQQLFFFFFFLFHSFLPIVNRSTINNYFFLCRVCYGLSSGFLLVCLCHFSAASCSKIAGARLYIKGKFSPASRRRDWKKKICRLKGASGDKNQPIKLDRAAKNSSGRCRAAAADGCAV